MTLKLTSFSFWSLGESHSLFISQKKLPHRATTVSIARVNRKGVRHLSIYVPDG